MLLMAAALACAAPVRAARLYVSNEDSGTISVVDTEAGRVVSTLEVGKRPRGLRLSRDGRRLLAAVSGSAKGGPGVDESRLPPPDRRADGIAVIDLASGRVERVLESGSDPETFDLSPDGSRVYVANEDAATLSVLDAASGKRVAVVPVGEEPEGVTVSPDGSFVYVTSESNDRIDVVDARRLSVTARIATAARPRAVAFSADGARAFATCEKGAAVTVIDARRHAPLRTLPLPPDSRPMGLTFGEDGTTLFVSTGRGGSVAVIDTTAPAVRRVIRDIGARPWGVAYASGRRLYTANGPSDDVSVIDAASGRVVARIAVGRSPWGLALGR